MTLTKRVLNFVFLASTFALTSAPAIYGQAQDTNLVGTVFDPAGAAVPGAPVAITNERTGVKTTTQTNASGQYLFRNVLPGTYTLTVMQPGFATTTLRGIVLSLNANATQNVSLQVGDVSTTVEVTDTALLIDTTTANITQGYERRESIDMPMAAQPLGALNLSLLAAGVASSGGIGLGEGPVVGGQRPRNNNFTIEGVDNNRKDVTGRNVDIPNEAVSEFTMLQNQYSAEFGNGTGGQFSTMLRGGTNEIHGALYEYFENRNLNAVDQSFARQDIRSNPRYDQNRLGASVGGPILKNKLFYYGLFQYNPLGQEGTAGSAILAPTAAGYSALGSIPGVSQTNLNILRQYLPAATASTATTQVGSAAIPIGIIPVTKPSYTNNYNWLVSGDYNPSDTDRVRVRFVNNIIKGFSTETLPALPAFFQGRSTTSKLLTISEFHNFSPTILNEFRFGYSRYNDDIPAGNFQFPGLDTFPNIVIEQDLNLQLGPYDQAPQNGILNQYQLIDNLSWSTGNHNLKFGWEGRKYIAPQNFTQRVRGDYNYTNLQQYLFDLTPNVLGERNVGGGGYAGNQINLYGFIQDEWRIRRNLTLSLGVRYEYKGVPRSDKDQALNAISSVPGLIDFHAPKPQKDAFMPRIGIAYSPGSSGRTSIRAGFGINYDKYFDNLGLNSRPPQVASTVNVDPAANRPNFLANGGIRPTATAEAACTTAAECRGLTSAYLFDQQLPYSIQWNLGVQRVFANDYTLEVRYLGTRGVHLYTQNQINKIARVTDSRFLPTYLTRPNAATLAALTTTLGDLSALSAIKPEFRGLFPLNITAFPNRGNSSYHGLAVDLHRRFTRNLLFRTAYTWSHNIDDSTADLFSTLLSPRRPEDFQNMRPERSSSFLDRRHRLVFSWVYDTPWLSKSSNAIARNTIGNWTLSGAYMFESPQYATVQSGVDSNLNGDAAGDRAIVNVDGIRGTGSAVDALDRNGNVVAAGSANIVAYVARNPTAQYILAGLGARTNSGRQTLPSGRINNWDVQLKKQFTFGEVRKLQFGAQAFNLFNHAQYVPGYVSNVQFKDSNETRNHLIPGNAIFNQPDQVYRSNSRTMILTARFEF